VECSPVERELMPGSEAMPNCPDELGAWHNHPLKYGIRSASSVPVKLHLSCPHVGVFFPYDELKLW
jgi:hypothetical protein